MQKNACLYDAEMREAWMEAAVESARERVLNVQVKAGRRACREGT
jgi:hypothetical protein